MYRAIDSWVPQIYVLIDPQFKHFLTHFSLQKLKISIWTPMNNVSGDGALNLMTGKDNFDESTFFLMLHILEFRIPWVDNIRKMLMPNCESFNS